MMHATELVDRRAIADSAGPVPVRPWVLLNYDTRQYPFAAVLSRDVFKVPHLRWLHEYLSIQRRKHGKKGELEARDNLTARSLMTKTTRESTFRRLYHMFMRDVLTRWIGRSLSYTENPSMRVHLSGTPSVSSFHHDIIVTKRIDQVNFWLPFTNLDGSATLWLESDYGKCDYAPVPIKYGQVLIFDGGYLGHGSVFNDTETTRVSLDMRFSYKHANTRSEGVELMNQMVEIEKQQQNSLSQYRPSFQLT